MKQFYSSILLRALKKSLLLFVVFLGAASVSNAQIYYGTLLGSNEFPSNSSPGTGKTIVTIDGNNMRVQVTFSGLVTQTAAGLPSGTTASHIHASAALPPLSLLHTAGVATQTPSFTGFPAGVQAGTYDHTFDMTQASSYNATYITANGGSVALAFAALKTQIAAGKAYLNIHSNAFPAGEIRGYLLPCPTINVSIPNAWALPSGTLPNTVYPAYAPASSLTLQTNVSGGTTPYTYNWSNGATASSITVSPTATTTYSVTVTDQNGCPGMASKTVNMIDISGGHNSDKIVVCHNGKNSVTIANSAVASHLQHGDMLASCSNTSRISSANPEAANLAVRVLGNPSRSHFDIQIASPTNNNVRMTVYDNFGRVIETKSLPGNQIVRLGSFYRPGIYLVEIMKGTQKQTLRLVKTSQ
jgi:hypothetical protein